MSSYKWYVIHTYSGFEKIVKANIEQRIKALGLSDHIQEIVIPEAPEVQIRDGKKQEYSKKFFPGYIFIKMKMSDDVWYAIRNTPKVSGFVGGIKPSPLPESEVNAIIQQMREKSEKPQPRVLFNKGEEVRIIDGPFTNFVGVVDEIYPEQGKLKVMVTIFGRSTPVELEFLQVERNT